MELVFLFTLVGLLIFQQVYYTIMVNKLINKLMSRNYGEYMQSDKMDSNMYKVQLPKESTEPMEDLQILHGLVPPLSN